MIRIAILDLNNGYLNQGMRCIRQIINEWSEANEVPVQWDEFDVRQKGEIPNLNYDVYISSGGPGDPLESIGSDWEKAYFNWLSDVEKWNANPLNGTKKYVFLICHSFQIVSRQYGVATVNKRKSTSFGVFPVHLEPAGKAEPVFEGLNDPFYVVDSRDYQVVQPNRERMQALGAKVLCIEKARPHLTYERAIMAIRFNNYMIGCQFHPEADAKGMSMYLQTEEKKQTVIKNYSLEKWHSMVEQLNDPDKIMWTYSHILPNFLNQATGRLQSKLAAV